MQDKRPKKSREALNIQFARGLEVEDIEIILQHELLRARSDQDKVVEVTLPCALVHEIKHRLKWYADKYGEVSD